MNFDFFQNLIGFLIFVFFNFFLIFEDLISLLPKNFTDLTFTLSPLSILIKTFRVLSPRVSFLEFK